jgi:hypothetical protein
MALVRISDHVRRAILNLQPPLWGKPVVASVLRAICEQFQEIEDMFWDVMTLRTVDVATGAQLKTLGLLVGEPDLGYAEEDYRALIKARIRINRSSGRANDLIEVLGILGTETVEVQDAATPARAQVTLDVGGLGVAIAHKMTRETRAAGVALDVYTNPMEDAGLRWSSAAGTGGVGGWGSVSDGSGAPLFGVKEL